MKQKYIKLISILLVAVTAFAIPVSGMSFSVLAESINSYEINGKTIKYTSVSDAGNEADYISSIYDYIWGENFNSDYSADNNALRTMTEQELKLTTENIKSYISNAELGSVIRISDASSLYGNDDYGHSVILVNKDSNGFTVFEYTNERKESYYTWEYFCTTYPCEYIKYVKSPKIGNNSIYAEESPENFTVPQRELYYENPMFNGYDVCWVQYTLKNVGYDITVDGYYSQHTEKIVTDFQNDFKLEPSGKVDSDTIEKLKNPVRQPDAPNARLTTPKNICMGDIVNVEWDNVPGAEYYNVYVYNNVDYLKYEKQEITGNNVAFTLTEPGTYIIKLESVNGNFKSDLITLSDRIIVKNDVTVTFVDDDGTVLCVQTVAYGEDAVTPASPKKAGHNFVGWDKEYENITSTTTVRAVYCKNTYTAKFIDYEGNVISTQKVKYGNSAIEPEIAIPDTYSFVGWDKSFDSITEDKIIKMVVINNQTTELPVSITSCSAVRAEEHSGYTITVELKNQKLSRVNGRVVASLKTKNGKFLTMTESSAFTIVSGNSKTLEVFVPFEGAAGIAEVYVVQTYSTLIPISTNVTTTINTDNDWSGWLSEEDAPAVSFGVTDSRTEYRYRTKQFTSSSKTNLAGWTQYNVTSAWGDYGGWSGWTTNYICGSDSRQVNTRTETYVNGYNMVSYCTQNANSPYYRQYRSYSIGGNYWGYGCRSSYGEWSRSTFWSPGTLNSASKIPPNTYGWCGYGGYNKDGAVGYAYGDFMWFPVSASYGSTTYYQYRDRPLNYTYYYEKWSDWSSWGTTETTANDNQQVETRETKRYLVNDPTEDESGELKTISGVVDQSFEGRQATLFIYKIDDASDYTNEYVGQTVIDEDGRYIFTFKLREEPSVKTGDFTVALGIEGANSLIYLKPFIAPKQEYTVNICEYDGTVISTQKVKKGESATIPYSAPSREGWTFVGWDYSNSSIYEDTNITAMYVQNEYNVAYIDWTNELFELKTYHYGDPLIVPDIANTDGVTAVGWDAVVDGVQCVKSNMIVTAMYETKEYTVNFYDYDGNVIESQKVEYGNSADAPALESTDKYVFLSWDFSSDIQSVKCDLDVHPEYCFVNSADAPKASLESGIYTEPVNVSFDCHTENSIIYYTINGGKETEYVEPICISSTSEITFYSCAMGYNDSELCKKYYIINNNQNEENNCYPVIVHSDDGSILDTYIISSGCHLSDKIMNVKQTGYIFDGYYLNPDYTEKWDNDINAVNKSIDLYIKWIPEKYKVTFSYENGDIINTQYVNYLCSAVAPETVNVEDGFAFVGWNTEKYASVTGDMIIYAIIKSIEDVASITLDKTTLVMTKGLSYQMDYTILPDDGKIRTIVWSSSDENVVVVDENGKISAKSAGTAQIKAYMPDSGVYDECTVKVNHNKYEEICLISNSTYTLLEGAVFGVSCKENTVNEIAEQIDAEKLIFKNSNGSELNMNDHVGTGAKICLVDNMGKVLDEVTVVVTGDVNGDGFVNNKDVAKLARILVEKDTFTTFEKMAADVNADAVVNNRDAAMLSRYLVGKDKI